MKRTHIGYFGGQIFFNALNINDNVKKYRNIETQTDINDLEFEMEDDFFCSIPKDNTNISKEENIYNWINFDIENYFIQQELDKEYNKDYEDEKYEKHKKYKKSYIIINDFLYKCKI